MKHTPGPWLLAEGTNNFVYALNDEGSNRFWLNVSSARTKNEANDEEVLANANLIVASPLMYEALEAILESTPRGIPRPHFEKAVEALAKARGWNE